jgi:hypothetical protein
MPVYFDPSNVPRMSSPALGYVLNMYSLTTESVNGKPAVHDVVEQYDIQ